LGKWLHHSHRLWEWFYLSTKDVIVQRVGHDYWAYRPCLDADYVHTRAGHRYARVGAWQSKDLDGCLPTTVRIEGDEIVHLATGPPLAWNYEQQTENDFWSYVRSLGGEWLWEHVFTPLGIGALVDAIAGGSAVLVTDGSYSRKIRTDIDGAGWMIYCRARKKVVFKGSFYEWCREAGSYRGELLGLLAVHLLVMAVEKFYDLSHGPRGLVACDNLGGLNKSKARQRKIPPGAKHADILRCLRRVHAAMRGTLQYKHVYGHQDKHKSWKNMTLLERLNKKCNELAKYAVSRGIIECPQVVSTDRQRLPLESVALFYNGSKISGECGREIRFQIGKVEARTFYITQLGWYATAFDNVDWELRDKALHGKPDMFKMWLFKQVSSFCATGKNMGRWFGSEHTECPNCSQPDEDSKHLLHCRDSGRYSLFRSEVNNLVVWLREGSTDPALATILSEYLQACGSKRLDALNLILLPTNASHTHKI
jgi:hypothetical protein